ncbi:anti-sigma factor [Actinotalea solisilvae]|uniref:anti-sigma factor n=1 Tax=Actinotalea solisilvae TaxID=2072922 RepID=UPI0018F1A8FF|nr:anti-sigma factor [Actinotalea solisilvae]
MSDREQPHPGGPVGPAGPSAPDDGSRDDGVRDLLGAYALDAVDDLERRAVERLVARDTDAAAELAQLRATVAELAATDAAPPPAGLRAAVLAQVAATVQDRPTAIDAVTAPRPRRTSSGRPSGRWLVAAAAAAVVALAVPSSVAWQQHQRAVVAEQRSADLAELLAAPGTEVLRGDVDGGGTAVAVLAADGAVLVADGLPALDADQTYQLWAMRDGVPVPAGLFEPTSGSAQVAAEDYRPGDGLAVSVEPAGGSAQPTTTPVVVLLPS